MTGARYSLWSSIDPRAFRELRAVCGLSVGEVAQLLRVTARSVRYWEAGQRRIPYCAFKLLRVVAHGDVGGRAWDGWRVVGGELWSPSGQSFRAWELE